MELVCKYAPHVLVDEQKRVKQFKEGLRLNIRVQVALWTHIFHMRSYSMARLAF